jgi:hypothetical protein
MKRLLILSVLLFAGSTESAAMDKVYHDLMDADLKAKRGAVIVKLLKLSDADAAIFGPIYDEYQQELDRLSDSRKILTQEYLVVNTTMSMEIAGSMIDQFFDLEAKELEIRQKYLDRLEQELTPLFAARFYNLDTKLNLIVDLQMASKLPLIEKTAVAGQ